MSMNNGIKYYIIAVIVISVFAVFITVVTHWPEEKNEELVIDNYSADKLSYEDFAITDEYRLDFSQKIIPAREPTEKWSWAQIEEYWTDPKEMAIEYIEKENDRAIEEIFEKVP